MTKLPKRIWYGFPARDAVTITGRSLEAQRADRNRGYAPEIAGRASHTVDRLAQMSVVQALSMTAAMIGPTTGWDLGSSAGNHIAYWALSVPGAIEDSSGGEFEAFLKEKDMEAVDFAGPWFSEGHGPFRYLIKWVSGRHHLCDDLNEAFAEAAKETFPGSGEGEILGAPVFHESAGAVVVIDLKEMGEFIAAKAGRPLAAIEMVEAG